RLSYRCSSLGTELPISTEAILFFRLRLSASNNQPIRLRVSHLSVTRAMVGRFLPEHCLGILAPQGLPRLLCQNIRLLKPARDSGGLAREWSGSERLRHVTYEPRHSNALRANCLRRRRSRSPVCATAITAFATISVNGSARPTRPSDFSTSSNTSPSRATCSGSKAPVLMSR